MFRVREGGGEFGGACLWGGVNGLALVLLDKRGGGVDFGFGSVPVQTNTIQPSRKCQCSKPKNTLSRSTTRTNTFGRKKTQIAKMRTLQALNSK